MRPRVGVTIKRETLYVGLLFALPAVLLYTVFVVVPIGQAFYYAFFNWNGLNRPTDFVGLGNFIDIVRDPVFRRAVGNNFLIAALSLVIQLPLALLLALLVGRSIPGRAFYRTALFLPYVLSDVATAVMWRQIYNPQFGLVNALANRLGWQPQQWLSEPDKVMYALFAVITWKYVGLYLVLFLSALQRIPRELEEAASLDGCSGWQTVRHITLPLLGSTFRLCAYLSVVGSLQYFDLVWIMTNGGPANASETMATYLVKFGFQRYAMGYGSAVGAVLFLICVVFALLYQRYVMGRDLEPAVGTAANR